MGAQKIVVYVRAADAAMLEEKGKDPPEWVRDLIRRALDRMKERDA